MQIQNLNSSTPRCFNGSGKALLKHLAVGPQHLARARCKARERARPARKNAMTASLSQQEHCKFDM